MGVGQSGKMLGHAQKRVAQDLNHSREVAPILPRRTMEMIAPETHRKWNRAMMSRAQVIRAY